MLLSFVIRDSWSSYYLTDLIQTCLHIYNIAMSIPVKLHIHLSIPVNRDSSKRELTVTARKVEMDVCMEAPPEK